MKLFKFKSNKKVTLEEYKNYLNTRVDFDSEKSILASAEYLYYLANDEKFVQKVIIEQINSLGKPNIRNPYSEQTIMLAFDSKSARYSVRLNFWLPVSKGYDFAIPSARFFSYDYPHDHNFSFLTVGAYGPGYSTIVGEYDPTKTIGYDGELVDIQNKQTLKLSRGTVMYYKGSHDIHTQLAPQSFSASINLLIHKVSDRETPQFKFDIENDKIESEENIPSLSWPMTKRLIQECDISNYRKQLRTIVQKNNNYKVRGEALYLLSMNKLDDNFVASEVTKENNLYAKRLLNIS